MPKPRRTSDATLVRRSQQGDRRAFSALLGRYDWRLRGLAHALLLDRAEMDVALATGYVRAWRDVVRVDPKEDVAAWLYRVTYNACIDQLRRAEAGSGSDAREATPGAHSGIAAGLATLPAAERVAVVLVDREGFSPASAARILGMPESGLSVTLDSARERLIPHIPEPTPPPDAATPAEPESDAPPGGEPSESPAAPGSSDVPDAADESGSPAASESPDVPDATDALARALPATPPPADAATSGNGSHPPDPSATTLALGNGNGKRNGETNGEAPAAPPAASASDATAPVGDAAVRGDDDTIRDDVEPSAPDDSGDEATARSARANGGNGGNGDRAEANGGNGNGNGAASSANRNRGKGRRARRRAQHVASQRPGEEPGAPGDDTA